MEPEDLEREFPGWVTWTGTGGWYARWLKSPDVTLRAEDAEGLRGQIQTWIAEHGGQT